MITRRGFLQAGTIAAGSTIAPAVSLMAEGKSSLPSSIAALKSMKSEAKPITRQEYLQRQENARRLMQSNRLDAILLMEGTSLSYFTGIRWWGAERLFATVLPVKGNAFYVCPAFEEGRAREQVKAHIGDEDADIRVWQEHESPYQLVAQGFRDRGLTTGSVGMEETVRFVFSDGISKVSPQTQLSSATAVTAGCRMRKSTHEIELMRLAAKVTLKAYEAAYRGLRAGMTQSQFEEMISSAHTRLGFPGEASVQVGEYSAYPHGSIAPQVIHEGAIILIDGGCKVEEYSSDISRTFVLGKPSDKMKKVFDIVHEAQRTALKTARPGLECQAVDAAARKVVSDGGYGPDYKFFTHRVGHGMGMDVHEWPYLVRGNSLPLEAEMTFSDEPGIYIRGEFGVRLEDDMHITENGAELFTPQSPSLEDPFATA